MKLYWLAVMVRLTPNSPVIVFHFLPSFSDSFYMHLSNQIVMAVVLTGVGVFGSGVAGKADCVG